jgi:hypothetical protein
LPAFLPALISSTSSDGVMCLPSAISLNAFQNASSRLTLVARPAIMVERLMIKDFIARCPTSSARARSLCRTITDMLQASAADNRYPCDLEPVTGLPSRFQWLARRIVLRASSVASIGCTMTQTVEPLALVKQIGAGASFVPRKRRTRPSAALWAVCRGRWSRAKLSFVHGGRRGSGRWLVTIGEAAQPPVAFPTTAWLLG